MMARADVSLCVAVAVLAIFSCLLTFKNDGSFCFLLVSTYCTGLTVEQTGGDGIYIAGWGRFAAFAFSKFHAPLCPSSDSHVYSSMHIP